MKSNFICGCGGLLYVDPKTNEEFCLTVSCDNYVNEKIRDDPTSVKKSFSDMENKLKLEILKFDSYHILRYLVMKRGKMIKSYFNGLGVKTDIFLTTDELLKTFKNKKCVGREKRPVKMNKLLDNYSRLLYKENFLDDILNYRIIVTTSDRCLILKYRKVFNELLNNYGIINEKQRDRESIFRYIELDHLEEIGKDFEFGMEMLDYFKGYWRNMVSIDYFLNYYYRTSFNYKFDLTNKDIALLLSLFFSMTTDYVEWNKRYFYSHLKKNNMTPSEQKIFIDRVIKNTESSPIILFDDVNNKILLCKYALLFFIIYSIGQKTKSIKIEGKKIASNRFENEIRQKFREFGYIVPFDEEFKFNKKSFAYDVISYSIEKKKIYLIEAKYRDFSPSTISGKTLIDQELSSEDGLLEISKFHNKRLLFFKKMIDDFSRRIKVDLKQFDIEAIVITKYTPLVYENDGIFLYSFDSFFSNLNK
jgi:hypothetical protein